ncbi:MAG: hypothetical protein ACFE9C_16640 [Candidatus Hodarchaeota archaeon]
MIDDIERIFQEKLEPTDQQLILGYSKVFIPFSNDRESTNSKYIYIGNEKMSFKERLPEYQEIFIYEFLTDNNELIKCFS